MTDAEIRSRLRTFLQDNFLYMKPDYVLDDGDSLLQKGVVDSMGVMEVLAYLESEFGVTPADDEITESNLGSVSAIAAFVAARR